MAVALRDEFHDNYAEDGDIFRRADLLFKRRAYLIAIIHF